MADLHEAVIHGAVKRIRPKMMTVGTTFIALMPIMWSMGTGKKNRCSNFSGNTVFTV
jgi:Cu/Ag efflux pump CusA